MIVNKYHQEILDEIKKNTGKGTKHSWDDNYLGSGHVYYNLTNPLKRKIAKDWASKHKTISLEEFIKLLDSSYKGDSYEEKTMVGILLEYLPSLRKQLKPELFNEWFDNLKGWAEVDATCQSNFTAGELLENWDEWEKLIRKLSRDSNINKRRASLVLLTGVVTKSDDPKLTDLAFDIIDKLKSEKDILITKAISWLLRDLVKLHKGEVEKYLEKSENSLPKIVVREVKRKILTGRK